MYTKERSDEAFQSRHKTSTDRKQFLGLSRLLYSFSSWPSIMWRRCIWWVLWTRHQKTYKWSWDCAPVASCRDHLGQYWKWERKAIFQITLSSNNRLTVLVHIFKKWCRNLRIAWIYRLKLHYKRYYITRDKIKKIVKSLCTFCIKTEHTKKSIEHTL